MSFCFLTLLVWSKCISYLRYAREEAFTRTKFHKFPEFFAKVYQFTNFKNLQMFFSGHFTNRKLILNFRVNESRYIGLFVVSGPIEKLLIAFLNWLWQYLLFLLFSQYFFQQIKNVGLPHIA